MTQIQILQSYSGKEFAEAAARGLAREGYPAFFDGEHGATSPRGLEFAERGVSLVFWTRDALYSKWVLEAAWKSAKRGALVECLLEPIKSPIEGVKEEPLDFSNWDGKPVGPLWKALMVRVLDAAGRPTGKLPLKEEAPPALVMAGLTFVVVATLAAGGLPNTRLQADSTATLAPEVTPLAPRVAQGGPIMRAPEVPVYVMPEAPPVSWTFETLDAPAPVQIVPLKEFDFSEFKDVAEAPKPAPSPET